MITVGSRNGRKGLGFGSVSGMEETELEEGEACSFKDEEASIDPDVALSYIDEKLHNVLGHFQKDFEGGVSAENLGAKFGGYGSFLPAYQRSPGLCHPRTPAKSSQQEGGHHNSVVLTNARLGGHGVSATNIDTTPATASPSLPDSSKRDASFEITNRSANPLEQKQLKVRIKVGSDNLSTQNNAAIYSGLGLDVSPSSSLEDSPTESEAFFREHQCVPDKSPNSILRIMTSFPVNGGLLLSPLPVDLIQLNKKEKLLKGSRYSHVSEGGRETSVMLNGFDSLMGELKAQGQKKVRPTEKNNISQEPKKEHNKDRLRSNDGINKKEVDIDMLACEELVSNALKLPLLSNSYGTEVSIEAHKDLVKGDYHKEEKSYDSTKGHSIPFKGRKASINETIDPLKQKTDCKTTVQEQNSVLSSGKDRQSSGGERESKENNNQDLLAVEIPKVQSVSKTKKGSLAESNLCKSESDNLPLKGFGKASDRHKEFFGENPLEPQENVVDSVEIPLKDRSSVKNIEKLSKTEACPKASSNSAPFPENGPIYNAHATVAPIENNDNWVCCDKCQKWRLLPIVTNPESLPEKWLCSMLNWLPGMNQCSFSEEDTTKAVVALNQSSHAQIQNNPVTGLDGIVSGVTPAAFHNLNQNRQIPGFHTVSGEAKKIHEAKEITETMNQDNPTLFPGFMRNLPPSVKSRSLNEVNQSPFASEVDFKQLRKSSDSDTENHKNNKREKSKILELYPDGGNTNISKMKIKRENDQDSFGASKKAKKESVHNNDQDSFGASKKAKKESVHNNDDGWKPESGGAVRKAGPSSSSGLTTDAAGNDQSNYTHRSSSKDSKSDEKDCFRISVKKLRDQASLDDSSLDSKQCSNIDFVAKKRKIKECSDYQEHYESICRKPENDGVDSIIAKENCKTGQKDNTRKEPQREKVLERDLTQSSLDGMDYLKKDLVSSHHVAATSSSSMVSGSHKSKTIPQEVKGSPVESVSSSPLRVSNADKLSSGRMNLEEKADLQDTCFFTNASSPRRGSEAEINHVSQLGIERKEKYLSVTQHGFHESDGLDFQNRDISLLSNSKTKKQVVASQEVTDQQILNGIADTSDQYFNKQHAPDRSHAEGRRSTNNYHATESHSGKSAKGSSTRSKDKNKSTKSEYNKHKNTDSSHASQDHTLPYQAKSKHGKNKVEKRNAYKKDSGGKFSDVILDCSQEAMQAVKQKSLRYHDGDRSPKVFPSDDTDHKETKSDRGRSAPLPPLGRGKKENGTGKSCVVFEGDDAIKGKKQTSKADIENGGVQINMRYATPNLKKVRDIEAPSPSRRDSSSQSGTNAIKEAKDLKHLADRLKNSGSNLESTGLYFQAALKFLHGASLLDLNSENSKNGEQSMQIYSSTAKLCQFCAHEYERSKDMAGAALAYKCMEVAYMRVIYSSHTSANRDRRELQSVLQIVPPGKSPSSACDIDSSNNVPTMDKVSIAKGVSPPQVSGSHVIAAQNRPSVVRLLNFVQDVNFAMEASRKSWITFGAANVSLDTPQHKEIISSIKRALDFNFHDVEGLLRLVRLAMDTISR